MLNAAPITRRLLYLWGGLWIVSFLTALGGKLGLSGWLGLFSGGILSGELSAMPGILGYALVHDPMGILHLAMNSLVFYQFAPEVERLFQGRRFVRLLLVSTIAGTLVSLLLALIGPEIFRYQVIGGGSGLVMTVLAICAALYPERRISLIVIQPRLISCFLVVIILDVLGLIATMAGRDGIVANQVHLAGALVGWLWVDGFDRFGWKVPHPFRAWMRKRQQRRAASNQQQTQKDHQELDRILEKISQQGMPSLTKAERAFLEKRSRDRRS